MRKWAEAEAVGGDEEGVADKQWRQGKGWKLREGREGK